MAGTRVDPPFYKTGTFFLRSLALSVQSIEISNQMELNGEVSNFEKKNLFNTLL